MQTSPYSSCMKMTYLTCHRIKQTSKVRPTSDATAVIVTDDLVLIRQHNDEYRSAFLHNQVHPAKYKCRNPPLSLEGNNKTQKVQYSGPDCQILVIWFVERLICSVCSHRWNNRQFISSHLNSPRIHLFITPLMYFTLHSAFQPQWIWQSFLWQ